MAWCPTLALVLRAPCPVASVALVRRRAREPALPNPLAVSVFRVVALFSPQVEAPDAGGAPAVALDGLFSGVSLCVSLSTHTGGFLFIFEPVPARLLAHTIQVHDDTSA